TDLDPQARYPSCTALVQALRAAREKAAPARPATPVSLATLLQADREVVPGYRLIRPLGQGGYGQVWEATAPGGKHVALKVIDQIDEVKNRHEFKALELIKQVDHDHLLELHAYWLLDTYGRVIPDDRRGAPDAPAPAMLVIASKLASQNLL